MALWLTYSLLRTTGGGGGVCANWNVEQLETISACDLSRSTAEALSHISRTFSENVIICESSAKIDFATLGVRICAVISASVFARFRFAQLLPATSNCCWSFLVTTSKCHMECVNNICSALRRDSDAGGIANWSVAVNISLCANRVRWCLCKVECGG